MVIEIEVRYFAAAAAGLGRSTDHLRYESPVTIGSVLSEIEAASPTADNSLSTVLGRCSFIVNGVTTRDRSRELTDGDQLDVLPPFAGG